VRLLQCKICRIHVESCVGIRVESENLNAIGHLLPNVGTSMLP
jgi:hypothetical protein